MNYVTSHGAGIISDSNLGDFLFVCLSLFFDYTDNIQGSDLRSNQRFNSEIQSLSFLTWPDSMDQNGSTLELVQYWEPLVVLRVCGAVSRRWALLHVRNMSQPFRLSPRIGDFRKQTSSSLLLKQPFPVPLSHS